MHSLPRGCYEGPFSPKRPTSKTLEVFKPEPVRVLKNCGNLKVGQDAMVEMIPAGDLYLLPLNSITVQEWDAVEGKHFEFVE